MTVLQMMNHCMKFTVKAMIWMTRILVTWLETIDGKGIPNYIPNGEQPRREGEEREQVEQIIEHERNETVLPPIPPK